MKKGIFTLSICALTIGLTCAQSIERSVIGSAGGIAVSGAAIITWNVGETVVNTLAAGNTILTQGFEQPEIKNTSVKSINANSNICVFPNPSSGIITLSISNPKTLEKYNADIRDMTGKLVLHSEGLDLSNGNASMDLSQLSAGCYFLQMNSQNQGSTIFKISIVK